ncbi:MAG TPA: acyloxyacyl hydrolase, partial [Bacteroidales bacterium]|nr:acyloxyacyl hydrolase [Bacteroidales bacterium]
AQADTLTNQITRKYTKNWNLSFEQGAMLGNGTDIGDQLAEASYNNGLDFRLGFRLNDHSDIYNQVYRLPEMGVGWYSSTFHQEEIGKPNALYYYFNMPIRFERSRKLTMSYLGAFGLSYNFNPYDEINNPGNVFIGSYRNCYVNFALLMNYHITPKWVTSLSLGFKHFSNGSFKQPNYGINLVPVSVSISYSPAGIKPFEGEKNIPHFIRHNQYNIALIAGSKNYNEGEPNYLKAAISINWLRALSYKYRGGLGFDIFYSAKAGPRTGTESTFSNSMSYAVVGSWEWSLNQHLYVPVAFAVYLKHSEANGERDPFYERVGIRYRFNNKMFAGVTIKAHKGVADFFEWTLGYTLHHDPNKY